MIITDAKLPESVLPAHILARLDRCSWALRHLMRWGIISMISGFALSLLFANLVVDLPAGHWGWPVFVWIIPPLVSLAALGLLLLYSRASFINAEGEYFRRSAVSEEQWINHCVALEEKEVWLDLTEPRTLLHYQKHFSSEESKSAMKAAADRQLDQFRQSMVAKMAGKGRWMANYFDAPDWLF